VSPSVCVSECMCACLHASISSCQARPHIEPLTVSTVFRRAAGVEGLRASRYLVLLGCGHVGRPVLEEGTGKKNTRKTT